MSYMLLAVFGCHSAHATRFKATAHYDTVTRILGQNQILYVDNQRLLLYWCFKRVKNGSCVQYDVDILVRSRHLAQHDMALLQPYLNMACVQQQHLRWFDLHCMTIHLRNETFLFDAFLYICIHADKEKFWARRVRPSDCTHPCSQTMNTDLNHIWRVGPLGPSNP